MGRLPDCWPLRKLARSGNLGRWLLEAHSGPGRRYPKTLPPRGPQIADSTAVRFADIVAHKQMFLGDEAMRASVLRTRPLRDRRAARDAVARRPIVGAPLDSFRQFLATNGMRNLEGGGGGSPRGVGVLTWQQGLRNGHDFRLPDLWAGGGDATR